MKLKLKLALISSLVVTSGVAAFATISCSSKSKNNSSSIDYLFGNSSKSIEDWKNDFPQFKEAIKGESFIAGAFKDQTIPENFYFPKGIKIIREESFAGAHFKGDVSFFGSDVETIDKNAFAKSTIDGSLDVSFFGKLGIIGSNAFFKANAKTISIDRYSKTASSIRGLATTAFIDFIPREGISLRSFLSLKSLGDEKAIFDETAGKNDWSKIKEWNLPTGYTIISAGTFKGAVIPSGFTLGRGISSIGESAFEGADLPENFSLGGTYAIGQNAFKNAKIKKGFTIPSSSVDVAAGSDKTAFASIDLGEFGANKFDPFTWRTIKELSGFASQQTPGRLLNTDITGTVMPEGMFKGFDFKNDLPTYEIPDNVTEISSAAFQGAILPSGFKIKPTIKKIGNRAFASAKLGDNVGLVVPSTVTSIDSYAFADIDFTGKVFEFKYNQPKIESSMFSNSKLPATFALEEGVKEIGYYAFAQATVDKLTLPTTIETLNNGVFEATTFKQNLDLAPLKKLISVPIGLFQGATVTNDFTLKGTQIQKIESNAFAEMKTSSGVFPTGFDLPVSIKTIGDTAFATDKINFSLADKVNLMSIGAGVFYDSILPDTFNLPTSGNLKTIGDRAFASKRDDESYYKVVNGLPSGLKFPSSVISYGVAVMEGRKINAPQLMADVDLNNATFGGQFFNGCDISNGFVIPTAWKSIPAGMFANCTFNMYKNTNDEHGTEASGVESNFKLPTTIANIESQAFIYAHLDFAAFSDSFKAITNLQKIGARAFYESRLQQGLTLPVGTYTIEKEAFIGAYTTGSTRPGLTWNNSLDANLNPTPGSQVIS